MVGETDGIVFKKRTRGRNFSARRIEKPSTSESDGEPVVKRSTLKKKGGAIYASSKKKRSKSTDSRSGSSNDSKEEIKPDDLLLTFSSSGVAERAGPSDLGATAVNEIETDARYDAQAQFERIQEVLKEGSDDKVYKGAAVYGAKQKKDTAKGNASSGWNRTGPMRAPNFLRQSVRWDFAPDICKDYKETGYCTFGDSCKFLHDRTDYKHGWELERDYLAGRMMEESDDKFLVSSSDDDECTLPFKCLFCRESFRNPVVTECKHYFCEHCALDHFRKTPKCYVCEKSTNGMFKVAKELVNMLKNRKVNELGATDEQTGEIGDADGNESTELSD